MRISLESLPFALLMIGALLATSLFAAWALYAQMHDNDPDPGWNVETAGRPGPPHQP